MKMELQQMVGGTIGIANFTATTGKVNLVDGQYVGINTTDGSLIIGPKGFDGSTADYVNFIAKNIQQSGKVVSGAGLTYIAGANNVSSNGSVAALPSNDASVAIDVSNLGGMYAGVVKVISTSWIVNTFQDNFYKVIFLYSTGVL